MRKRLTLALVLMLPVALTVSAQGSRGYGRRSGSGRIQNKDNPSQDPLASLPGTVKVIDKKILIIEDADTNELEFHSSKKTGYLNGTKKITPDEIKPGDRVTVEARRELDGSLAAVNVHLEHSKAR